jgi:hypothetical protein
VGEICPECGAEYQRLAMHWNRSDCPYPTVGERRREILRGVLMGDGDLHGRRDTNHHFRVRMTSRAFLDHLDDELGVLSKGVYLARSASEQVETARQNQRDGRDGFEVVNPGEYSDLYGLRSCSHPELNDLRRWYDGSEKRFPPDLELTPS